MSWTTIQYSSVTNITQIAGVHVLVRNGDGLVLRDDAPYVDGREDEIAFQMFRGIARKFINKYAE